jgi:NAD(P)H dehydrogenase (quinone)
VDLRSDGFGVACGGRPFAVYGTVGLPEERFAAAEQEYRRRLDGLFTDEPVPFRSLADDYDHDMRLRPDLEAPSAGLDLHIRPRASDRETT